MAEDEVLKNAIGILKSWYEAAPWLADFLIIWIGVFQIIKFCAYAAGERSHGNGNPLGDAFRSLVGDDIAKKKRAHGILLFISAVLTFGIMKTGFSLQRIFESDLLQGFLGFAAALGVYLLVIAMKGKSHKLMAFIAAAIAWFLVYGGTWSLGTQASGIIVPLALILAFVFLATWLLEKKGLAGAITLPSDAVSAASSASNAQNTAISDGQRKAREFAESQAMAERLAQLSAALVNHSESRMSGWLQQLQRIALAAGLAQTAIAASPRISDAELARELNRAGYTAQEIQSAIPAARLPETPSASTVPLPAEVRVEASDDIKKLSNAVEALTKAGKTIAANTGKLQKSVTTIQTSVKQTNASVKQLKKLLQDQSVKLKQVRVEVEKEPSLEKKQAEEVSIEKLADKLVQVQVAIEAKDTQVEKAVASTEPVLSHEVDSLQQLQNEFVDTLNQLDGLRLVLISLAQEFNADEANIDVLNGYKKTLSDFRTTHARLLSSLDKMKSIPELIGPALTTLNQTSMDAFMDAQKASIKNFEIYLREKEASIKEAEGKLPGTGSISRRLNIDASNMNLMLSKTSPGLYFAVFSGPSVNLKPEKSKTGTLFSLPFFYDFETGFIHSFGVRSSAEPEVMEGRMTLSIDMKNEKISEIVAVSYQQKASKNAQFLIQKAVSYFNALAKQEEPRVTVFKPVGAEKIDEVLAILSQIPSKISLDARSLKDLNNAATEGYGKVQKLRTIVEKSTGFNEDLYYFERLLLSLQTSTYSLLWNMNKPAEAKNVERNMDDVNRVLKEIQDKKYVQLLNSFR